MAKDKKKNKKKDKKKSAALQPMSPELAAFAKKNAKNFKKGKKAADESRTFAEYDDGYYIVALSDADIGQSESSNRWQSKYEFTILDDGENQGKLMYTYQGLEGDEATKYLNWFLARLGEDTVASIDELRETHARLIARRPKCRVQLKTTKGKGDNAGKEFQNLRIKKVIEDMTDEALPSPSGGTSKKKKGKKGGDDDVVIVTKDKKKDKKKGKKKKGKK